ncbi:MAG: helix-turn-helix domain-containing protein [Planctomycetota bacterium]
MPRLQSPASGEAFPTIGRDDFGTDGLSLMARIGTPVRPVALHAHTFTEIVVPRSGSALHETLGETCAIAPGEICVIPPGMPHAYSDVRRLRSSLLMLRLDELPLVLDDLPALPGFARLFAQGVPVTAPWRFHTRCSIDGATAGRLHALIDGLIRELITRRPGWRSAALALVQTALVLMCRQAGPADPDRTDRGVRTCLEAMQRDPGRPWNLPELAEMAGCSVSAFTQRFRRATGSSPMQWLLDRRLQEARHLLATTTLSITSIALECGFSDSTYLARRFRAAMGCTPRHWRSHGLGPVS